MNKIKKIILRIMLSIIGIIMFWGLVVIGVEAKMESLRNTGFTKYNLTVEELVELWRTMNITTVQAIDQSDIRAFYNVNTYCYEKSKFVLLEGEHTSQLVEKFNELVSVGFGNNDFYDVLEKYNINIDNPMTVEWVMHNPKAMCEILASDDIIKEQLRMYKHELYLDSLGDRNK